mmetsp:Transcript_19612/g.48813  ORF Transcript_19612/g.48813 Transcript_19612/m.48813 type:complete len:161 (-) Transcript_19612:119-601(-)
MGLPISCRSLDVLSPRKTENDSRTFDRFGYAIFAIAAFFLLQEQFLFPICPPPRFAPPTHNTSYRAYCRTWHGVLTTRLLEETPNWNLVMNLFHEAFLNGRRRVSQADGRLFFESVDGRGQEAVRHFGGGLDAFVNCLGQILFEIGQQKPAESLGSKRGH